jgi:hypothetical protein
MPIENRPTPVTRPSSGTRRTRCGFGYKLLIGAAAIGVASASSFPNEISAFYRASFPAEWQKRQRLPSASRPTPLSSAISASEREECTRG